MSRNDVKELGWEDFLSQFRWAQGEHVSMVGPTGGGKSTLALQLLSRRKRTVILATKPRDKTMTDFMKSNPEYRRMSKWDPHREDRRIVLWPPIAHIDDMDKQSVTMSHALSSIYRTGAWCVMADELRYLSENLRLRKWLNLYWLQGRSLGVSLIAITQRPAWVPREMYDQATHLFFWKDNDDVNLKQIGGLGAQDSKMIRESVRALPKHSVLYVNTRDDTLVKTRMEL